MSTTENRDRAERAAMILDEYDLMTSNQENNVRDLLADLMHFCSMAGPDFDYELEQARANFEAEATEAQP